MVFVNVTPHAIVMNDGRIFEPSGTVARVAQTVSEFDADGIATQTFGSVTGVPAQVDGVVIIASAMIKSAMPDRMDVVAPATNHADTVRNEKGHIVSVPGFVR